MPTSHPLHDRARFLRASIFPVSQHCAKKQVGQFRKPISRMERNGRSTSQSPISGGAETGTGKGRAISQPHSEETTKYNHYIGVQDAETRFFFCVISTINASSQPSQLTLLFKYNWSLWESRSNVALEGSRKHNDTTINKPIYIQGN